MRRRLQYVLAILLASPALGQSPAPSTADLVARLAGLKTPWLRELEAVVGPLHRDLSVWEEAVGPLRRDLAQGPIEHLDVRFTIDFYHQDPQREENVQLASWDVLFRGGADEALARLRQRFGEGQPLDYAVGHPHRFGDLFLTPLPAGRFQLAWYAEEPEWAVPRRSPADERALEDRLIVFLRSGIRNETIEKAFARPGPLAERSSLGAQGPQWRLEVSPDPGGRPRWVSIEIRGLPLDATRLIASLGLREPGLIASDVHLSNPDLSDLQTGKQPVVDGYEVDVRLDQELLAPVPARRPATAAWKPKSWRIRGLWLRSLR
jgi:hypothetical protein